ncbi:ribosomal protection-like ABC-F family protein [Alkalihalobacillus sp. AL-G]|uniref:ribosomal protection-like ABC-F family protein n=1 Tax=Alkalihalobacillus sp. AL-G TaxID=2926399 RepID=UPI00272D2EA8|nr:ABC-F type ribosomal protection protein [Alkalihalobacillus sp. AL-G]WLD93290.1 ABC-F type ribosomal protection protein [Alkalihalobacillus sp. AL-G]
MLLLKAEDIAIEIKGNVLFENASIEVCEGDHIALIGKNGIGKTTLISCLLGIKPLTKGTIKNRIKPEEWGWMKQEDSPDENVTTREFVELENLKHFTAKKELAAAERQLNTNPDDERTISLYNNCLQRYLDVDGYEWETKVEKCLLQLKISSEHWSIPFESLSGGQKTRAKLARVLTNDPKILVLDEPTNHLDVESLEWLANWLSNYKGAILFISHDRSFIDEVAKITYELTEKGTTKYNGGYSDYRKQKELEQKTQLALYQKQETEKRKLLESISSYKQWFQKAHNAASERDPFAKKKANKNMTRSKAKEMALERLENNRVEKPKDGAKLNVELEGRDFSSRSMVTLSEVSFSFSNEWKLFDSVSFSIERGDRIAVVGRNGSGKTTLLNLLTGQLTPDHGRVAHHPKLRVGYFMQELEGLDPNFTVLDQVLALPSMTQSEARTILACFLFRGDSVYKKVDDLSMGEKCRVAFVKLYFSNANLLVLDEPTNYLDIGTRERIEDALSLYPGAVVTVSHDPYMLEKVANRVFLLGEGPFMDYRGSYADWKNHRRISSDEQRVQNEKERLQLQLTNLLTEEVSDDQKLQNEYQLKLKDLNARIIELENEK